MVDAVSTPQSFSDSSSRAFDTAPTSTISSWPSSTSSTSTSSPSPRTSGSQVSQAILALIIVLPTVAVLTAVGVLYVFCLRRRRRGREFGVRIREITGASAAEKRSLWSFCDRDIRKPSNLSLYPRSMETQESNRLNIAPLSPALESPRISPYRFGPPHRTSTYSHVRTISDGTDSSESALSEPRKISTSLTPLNTMQNPVLLATPTSSSSDGKGSLMAFADNSSPVSSTGRHTPERPWHKLSRSREKSSLSTIGLPISPVDDHLHVSSGTAPLAWGAGRIEGDGTGRLTPTPFEIRGFTPISARHSRINFNDGQSRHVENLDPHNAPQSPIWASIPFMLAPDPPSAMTCEQDQPKHEVDSISKTVSIAESGVFGQMLPPLEETPARSRPGTIRSVTTIRSSIDSVIASRPEKEPFPPMPCDHDMNPR